VWLVARSNSKFLSGLLASSAPSACFVQIQSIVALQMSCQVEQHVSRICIMQFDVPIHTSTYNQRHRQTFSDSCIAMKSPD